ncbi:riboflavin kinase [Armillaria mellea]|nr:riboflavin kinase [Armillaria mellea]
MTARPTALFQTDSFRDSRPLVVGPDHPESPFPILLSGAVQRGFGRGGKDLNCPTANLPDEAIEAISSVAQPGVYYGYAQVPDAPSNEVWPMVMSLGWNPFYKNERLTAEIHVMHEYTADFYGMELRAVVLGYIRPELDFTTMEALIETIETDKRVALHSLDREAYKTFATHPHFVLNE